ncbi:hypothetical protein K501DRAFT_261852 [Backusella circina FSU 941]|nr:hypothetical protein K501DRAFT_261852 [Backusella circina FSU 941]
METPPVFKSKRQEKIWLNQKRFNENKKKDQKTYVNQAPFRYCERNFKSKVPPPDFTNVIDFKKQTHNTIENQDRIVSVELKHDLADLSSLFGTSTRQAYVLKNIPGLIVIPNAFAPEQQRYLIKQCLLKYPQAPNTSNLHTHYEIPSQGIWPLFEQQRNGKLNEADPDFYVQKKKIDSQDASTYSDSEEEEEEEEEEVMACSSVTACSDDFSPIIDGPKIDPPPAPGVPLLSPSELIRKLRWVTLGYQYHWPTKTYHLDRRYPFPEDVSELTRAVVTAVEGIGYQDKWRNTYKGEDYKAEAGVVNYYQYRDALMGHVDRSELNMDAPLVSLSLGSSCIYVIGGETRDTEPAALYLRSGDMVVMTGPCRRVFHGVPLIIEDSLPDYLSTSNNNNNNDDDDYKLYSEFMKTARINLNIRQVNTINNTD